MKGSSYLRKSADVAQTELQNVQRFVAAFEQAAQTYQEMAGDVQDWMAKIARVAQSTADPKIRQELETLQARLVSGGPQPNV